MIIKLLEQPIIAINEAEIAGTVDGVIIKGKKVNCIYHGNMENHFTIPVENTIIGSDAVMIQDVAAMVMASQKIRPLKSMLDVYNISGRHLGCLQGIEVNSEYVVQYLYTEAYRIEMSKIVNFESVIVVDAEEAELKASSPEHFFGSSLEEAAVGQQAEVQQADAAVSEIEEEKPDEAGADEEAAVSEEESLSMEIGPEINWKLEKHLRPEKSQANAELSVVRTMHQSEEKTEIPGVDPKYAYLCGKQLLEDIDIEDTIYAKGTIIDAELIKHAIGNNAIVKVIVNAEE